VDTIFTLQTVMQAEDDYRKEFTTQNEIVVYVLFADGYYYNQKLLGYAYRNTSVVLFDRHIKENASRYKKHSLTYLQSRVLQHEFGHLLGLVNAETASGEEHHDAEHGKHCTNKNCLMYYLVDTEDYPLVLLKREPPALDKNCIQVLRKNGGK
jgi:predicted Zn-dependent protease